MMHVETTKKVKYFLEYKFPIVQLLSQNKFIWITKMYFIFESKNRKNFLKKSKYLSIQAAVF